MNSNNFPIDHYLERIGLSCPPSICEGGLHQIHSNQAFSIPFENLDIPLGQPISLKQEDLVHKILNKKRGGYCFELNGILHLALTALGFSVTALLARVLYGCTEPTARTHEALIVTIAGKKWLADVGFGGPGLRAPLLLTTDLIQEQYGEQFRFRSDPKLGIILQKATQGEFLDIYAFDEDELTLDIDFEAANHFTSTWPASLFKLHKMCALPNPGGRTTLLDMELTIYKGDQIMKRDLNPGPDYLAALAEHFGIDLKNEKFEG
jgi:N-hydroxyarylamine O-acetyltransferase